MSDLYSLPALRMQFVDGIDKTPAAELAVRGWLDNLGNGLCDGTLNMHSSYEAVIGWAPNGRDTLPVGVITFANEGSRVWVHQSYVLPEFRGRGVYSSMWSSLVAHVAENCPKVHTIESATHVRNTAMRAIAKKLGRTEDVVGLKFVIPR